MPLIRRQQSNQAGTGTGTGTTRQIPSINFRSHFVLGDGDCLFRALQMGRNNTTSNDINAQQITDLRRSAANYVADNRQALIAHPSFGGAVGVDNLYRLLMTRGEWNADAGDLVAPILARVVGRELRILLPAAEGRSYEANENRIFRPQDPGLPAGQANTGQPPILLAHIDGRHYEYLESRHVITRPVPLAESRQDLRNDIMAAFTHMEHGRVFTALPQAEQGAEVVRISRSIGLRQSAIRDTLVGEEPRRNSRQALSDQITNAFNQGANGRAFTALTRAEQDAEVVRIAQATGYRRQAILTTLNIREYNNIPTLSISDFTNTNGNDHTCPISTNNLKEIKQPVAWGNSIFEYSGLCDWLNTGRNRTHPVTREPYTHDSIVRLVAEKKDENVIVIEINDESSDDENVTVIEINDESSDDENVTVIEINDESSDSDNRKKKRRKKD